MDPDVLKQLGIDPAQVHLPAHIAEQLDVEPAKRPPDPDPAWIHPPREWPGR